MHGMPAPSRSVLTAIVLEVVGGVATLAWTILFIGFITGQSSRTRDLFFFLAPMLGALVFGLSLTIRFLALDANGRVLMSVASVLFAATVVLLFLPSWNWYSPSFYCTGCMEFFYLPVLGVSGAGAGLVVEAVGIWRWWMGERLASHPGP